jgi:hypothetical protein
MYRGNCDASVGTATSSGLDDWVHFPARVRNFYFLHCLHTGSGAYPTSYPNNAGPVFSGVKRPGREADHSAASSSEVKNYSIYVYDVVIN